MTRSIAGEYTEELICFAFLKVLILVLMLSSFGTAFERMAERSASRICMNFRDYPACEDRNKPKWKKLKYVLVISVSKVHGGNSLCRTRKFLCRVTKSSVIGESHMNLRFSYHLRVIES